MASPHGRRDVPLLSGAAPEQQHPRTEGNRSGVLYPPGDSGVGYQLWIEERDKAVWHLATDRHSSRRYRVVCGWEMTENDSRIYPKKPHEPGPT